MKRTIAFLAAFCAVWSVHAEYSVTGKGTWPKSWPKELEPLRKQSSTFEGPKAPHQHYAIPFTKREEFESAWPHILKVKSKGPGVRLVRAPNFFLGENIKAGVIVHSPPPGQADNPAPSEAQTYIELVVDGDIVDLNRIPLPADTPITDERFKDGKPLPGSEGGADPNAQPKSGIPGVPNEKPLPGAEGPDKQPKSAEQVTKAMPNKIRVYIEKVDADSRTITASCMTRGVLSDAIKPLRFENLPVSEKAKITDRGKEVQLKDLKLLPRDTHFYLFLRAYSELGFEVVGIETIRK